MEKLGKSSITTIISRRLVGNHPQIQDRYKICRRTKFYIFKNGGFSIHCFDFSSSKKIKRKKSLTRTLYYHPWTSLNSSFLTFFFVRFANHFILFFPLFRMYTNQWLLMTLGSIAIIWKTIKQWSNKAKEQEAKLANWAAIAIHPRQRKALAKSQVFKALWSFQRGLNRWNCLIGMTQGALTLLDWSG